MRTVRKISDDMERREAKRWPNGKRQIMSGALYHLPGDIVIGNLLVEHKYSEATDCRGEKQIVIHREDLLKIIDEAARTGKFPALIFRYKGDDRRFIVFDAQVLEDYLWSVEKEKNGNSERD